MRSAASHGLLSWIWAACLDFYADMDKSSLCSWPSTTTSTAAWKRWSHERLDARDFAWSNGEVRPKKKPWSLSREDTLVPPSAAKNTSRPLSLMPVKRHHGIAMSKSVSPQALRHGDEGGIAVPRRVGVEEGRGTPPGRVPSLWRSFLLQAAGQLKASVSVCIRVCVWVHKH